MMKGPKHGIRAAALAWGAVVIACGAQQPSPHLQEPAEPRVSLKQAEPTAPAAAVSTNMVAATVDGPMEAAGMEDVPVAARQHMEDGFFEMRVGNTENAIRAFQRALDIAPDHPRLLFGLGTALVTAKRHAEAVEVFQRANQIRPHDHLILNNLAWVHATTLDPRLRSGEKALALAREALLVAPEDHHVWSTMAEAYFISGDYEKAGHCAREAERLANLAGAGADRINDYRLQAERCEAAAQAMSILD